MEVEDTLAYLTGTWKLSREIDDHLSGLSGLFVGDARVRSVGRTGRYEENGRLRFGATEGRAHRTLGLTGTPGGVVSVHFSDGRHFFDLDLATGICAALHRCSRDRYELEFNVSSADLLLERWRVCGPTKNYQARTLWRRN